MADKPLEERVADLEAVSHIHTPVDGVLNNYDANPTKADSVRADIERRKLEIEDIEKAKKTGKLFGDPILEF